MNITQQQRQDLTLAVVAGEHQIDADCIRLHRDPTQEGSALSQLVDRVVAVIEQSTAQPQAVLTPREIELLREIRLHAQFGLNEGWQREARNLLLELEQYYRTIPPSGEIAAKSPLICPRCKVDRLKDDCPGPRDSCPIKFDAQSGGAA